MANTVLEKDELEIEIPLCKTEIKPIINNSVINLWQKDWKSESKERHLYKMQAKVGKERKVYENRKKDSEYVTSI